MKSLANKNYRSETPCSETACTTRRHLSCDTRSEDLGRSLKTPPAQKVRCETPHELRIRLPLPMRGAKNEDCQNGRMHWSYDAELSRRRTEQSRNSHFEIRADSGPKVPSSTQVTAIASDWSALWPPRQGCSRSSLRNRAR